LIADPVLAILRCNRRRLDHAAQPEADVAVPAVCSQDTLKQSGSRNPADHPSADNNVALPDNE
jgi:hypothetical protein